jgi:hypothetical protein
MSTTQTSLPDDEARRAYWTEQLDEAADFMQRANDYPVKECGEPMEALAPAVEAAAATKGLIRPWRR